MLDVITPPQDTPLALSLVKKHLNVDLSDQDDLIALYLDAAIAKVEGDTGKSLITRTYKLTLDEFVQGQSLSQCIVVFASGFSISIPPPIVRQPPGGNVVRLPLGPVQSLTTFTYIKTDGTTGTLVEGTDFLLDKSGTGYARVAPLANSQWPEANRQIGAIEIEYVAGFGDDGDSVPGNLKQAILLLVGGWFQTREPVVIGSSAQEMPAPVGYLGIIGNLKVPKL